MYVLLTESSTVAEIIPDIDPVFPGISIEARYTAEFVASLLHVDDETDVQQNWIYDPERGAFAPPPKPEPEPEPVPVDAIPKADLDAAYREGVNSYA